jgi:G3E family GTPase
MRVNSHIAFMPGVVKLIVAAFFVSPCIVTEPFNHLLNRLEGPHVALAASFKSEVNIDANLAGDAGAELSRTEWKLVEITSRCNGCTLRDGLLKEVSPPAVEARFGCLLVDSTVVAKTLPVPRSFTFAGEHPRSFGGIWKHFSDLSPL